MNLSGKPRPTMADTDISAPGKVPPSGRLRLLEALDALLVCGGVSDAARALAISPPAMSRLLAQLRVHYGDPLLVRAGNRRMVPTPFALRLRDQVHAFRQSAEQLLAQRPDDPDIAKPESSSPDTSRPEQPSPPGAALHVFSAAQRGLYFPRLVTTDSDAAGQSDGAPTLAYFVQRREGWIRDADSQTRLAGLISALAGGQATSRALRTDEAADAMAIILRGEAQSVQIGAFLAALQLRGPTGEELAGMVTAARATLPGQRDCGIALDWPAYTSPRNQRIPWFLLAVKALAEAGYSVALHGPGYPGDIKLHVAHGLGIPLATSMDDARRHLDGQRCVYVPLNVLSPQLQAINGLYTSLGMRNASHLAVQLLNPFIARATVLGAPSQHGQSVHRDAMIVLGQGRLLSVSTHRDVAQGTPHRLLRYSLIDGDTGLERALPAINHRRPPGLVPGQRTIEQCLAAWSGQLRDPSVRDVIVDTIAFGLIAAGAADSVSPADARAMAQDLWAARLTARPCPGPVAKSAP